MPFGQVRDIQVFHEIVGSGPRLLLINGTGADLRRKQPWVDRLNDHFTVLRYDQRGLGQTDKPDVPYSMADYADDAAALMALVGWDSALALGVSFGGSVAQELARRHPKRIERLALACSNPGGSYGYPLLALSEKDAETRALTMLALDLRKTPEWQAAHPAETEAALEQGRGRGAGRDPEAAMGARRQLEAREKHDAIGWLDQIRVPTKMFGGRYDGLGTIASQEALTAGIPGATMQLFKGAHSFLGEDRTAIPSIVAFLTGP